MNPSQTLAGLVLALVVTAAQASEWPQVAPGNWRFQSTTTFSTGRPPVHLDVTTCVKDPVAKIKAMEAKLRPMCPTFDVSHRGNVRTVTAVCRTPQGAMRSRSVTTFLSRNAYSVVADTVYAGFKTHEERHARRVGSCR